MTRRLKNRSGFNISFKRLLLLSNSFLGKDNIIHAMILQDDKKRSENKWNSFLEKNYYFLFRSLENDSLSLENFHSQNRVTRGGKSCKERIRYTRDGFRSSKERWILEIPRGGRRERNGRVASFLPDDARDTRVALFRWRVPPRVISIRDESRGFTQSRDEKTPIPCSWKFLNDWREFYLFKMKQKTKINERKEPLQLISLYMKIPKRVKTG